ncbi:MAG: alpha/beta-type small acid-soluble spore protein [Firmicutes bacterium]|nr:alpha/beta-type small acid-soluble spore protein [Bacillota bacterium]
MGTGQKSNTLMVKEAAQAMEKFKYEVANELNINMQPIQGDYWGYMTARDCGSVGGQMVKRMIEAAERSLAEQAAFQASSAFRQSVNTQQTGQNLSSGPGGPSVLSSIPGFTQPTQQ